MRKLILCLALGLPLAGACAPSGGGPTHAVGGGPADIPQLTPLEAAEAFFKNGPGSVPDGGTPDADLGGISGGTLGMGVHMLPVPGFPGVYNVTLRNTGSGYVESFVLQIPSNPPPGPRPLLVAFHKFGVSHADTLFHTTFPQECDARGWYFVAPLGASQMHFSSLVSQINTQRVLDIVCATYPVDRARIYGVGFSMGGGAVATYAARHLDPDAPHFAAIVNHTGTVSIADAYALEYQDAASDAMELWNGGTPTTASFSYQRCSTIDIDPLTGLVGVGTDLARNLGSIKVMTVLATGDTHPYLSIQTQAWVTQLATLGVDNTFVTPNYVGHSWDALDDTAVCNWFSTLSFVAPTSGNQLADGDGQHVAGFTVQQETPGTFTPFQWLADPIANRLSIWGARNLQRLTVDVDALGLSYTGTLRWNHSNADSTPDELLLTGVPYAPTQVLRDGQLASCVYDAQLGTCLITDADGTGHMWQIQF